MLSLEAFSRMRDITCQNRAVAITFSVGMRLAIAGKIEQTHIESVKRDIGSGNRIPIDIPTRLDDTMKVACDSIGIADDFRAVAIFIALGIKALIKDQVSRDEIGRATIEADKALHVSPSRASSAKDKTGVPARPKSSGGIRTVPPPKPLVQKRSAVSTPLPGERLVAPERKPAEATPLARTPEVRAIVAAAVKRMRIPPGEQLMHLFCCSVCNDSIEVLHEEFLLLAPALGAKGLKRPSCEKHGGYKHLIETTAA